MAQRSDRDAAVARSVGDARYVGGSRPLARARSVVGQVPPSGPSPLQDAPGRPGRRRFAARDALLGRLRSTTRWVGVGTAVAIGILTVYVGRAFPGHDRTVSSGAAGASSTSGTSSTATSAGSTAATSTTATSAGSTASTASAGTSAGSTTSGTTLTPSTQAPTSSSTSSGVVSGAS